MSLRLFWSCFYFYYFFKIWKNVPFTFLTFLKFWKSCFLLSLLFQDFENRVFYFPYFFHFRRSPTFYFVHQPSHVSISCFHHPIPASKWNNTYGHCHSRHYHCCSDGCSLTIALISIPANHCQQHNCHPSLEMRLHASHTTSKWTQWCNCCHRHNLAIANPLHSPLTSYQFMLKCFNLKRILEA